MNAPENLTRTSSGGTIVATIEEGKTMATDAQLRANYKYRKQNEKQYFLGLSRTTRPKMIDYMESLDNKQGYIKHLIAVDMKSKGLETDGLDGE